MAMTGRPPASEPVPDVHPLVTDAARRFAGVRTGASGDLYHALLPTILAQRITAGEAVRQWARLCHELGEPAPARTSVLLLPPRPERLAGRPAWWFHPLGIEAKRARPLAEVGRIADRLWDWVRLPLDELAAKLSLVRGIGPWTVGSVLGPVCGDDDAVIVGDYHLPHLVAWNLAGEAAGRRRAHARPARTVPRRPRPGRPPARHRRPAAAGVRPAPPDPPDAPMVMARTTPADAGSRTAGRTRRRRADRHGAIAAAPANGQQRSWRQALTIGICAFVVSRLCVLAGAGVRASQVTVDAAEDRRAEAGHARSG